MQRADFTVVMKATDPACPGAVVRYSANHLSVGRRCKYAADGTALGCVCTLSFISSGEMVTVEVEDVDSVRFYRDGITHCGECDGPLWSIVGHGIAANPKLPSEG